MSEDAWKDWYRDEKPSPAGAGPAPEATHDMTVATPSPGAGAPGAAGPPGTRGRWPEQPPVRSGYQAEPDWTRPVGGGTSGSGGGGTGLADIGWRRWLRPKRILLIVASFVVLVLLGGVITYFYLNSKLSRADVLVNYSGRPVATQCAAHFASTASSSGMVDRARWSRPPS